MTHLRRYLEQTGALAPDHLDMAIRRQQIYGGSLDTVLLELELIDAHTLGELLVQACGLPIAPFALIDDERDRPWHTLPSDVLDIGWAVPLVMRGSEVWIAVHPDLPNERLGALYRMVPNVSPFVIPECALEKIAAERASSIVPQRYAVLCVAYLSAMRRRPSVSDIGFPMLHEDASGSMRHDLDRPSRHGTLLPNHGRVAIAVETDAPAVLEDEFERRSTMVYEPPRDDLDVPSDLRLPLATAAPEATPPAGLFSPPPLPGVASPSHRTLVPTGPMGVTPDAVVAPPVDDALLRGHTELVWPRPTGSEASEELPAPEDRTLVTPAPPVPPDTTRVPIQDVVAEPIVLNPTTTIVGGPPPVRFTNRGTMISSPRDEALATAQAESARRLSVAREALTTATTRDAVLTALAGALLTIAPRTAMLRVRNRELVGLSTAGTKLADPAGRVVPVGKSGLLARVQDDGRYAGFVDDEVFANAFEIELQTPCLVRRIDVAGRPTLVVYVDRAGAAFAATDPSVLDELCALTGRALETVVKLRRDLAEDSSARIAPIGAPPEFGTTPPTPSQPPPPPAVGWRAPRADAAPELILTDGPAPPRTRTIVDGSPPPAPRENPRSARATAAIDGPAPEPRELPSGVERLTAPYQGNEPPAANPPTAAAAAPPAGAQAANHASPEHPRSGQLLTIHAMPPPPPLPPPPPMGLELGEAPMDTLMGLPPPVSTHDAQPRFVPPPLDDRDNSGIIPLSSPIDQPSMRGRIELDDEDWSHGGRQLPSESMQRQVDAALASMASGVGSVAELRAMGEPALVRLAAQFPGPLEVLRRDLRALPPPSAHGPLIRAAIVLGSEFVPHLVDLFDHPSPDVRFYAGFVFQELRDPRAMRPLSELAFDTSGDVRVISMRVLETYSRSIGFADAVRVVRAQLDSTNRTRQLYAARAVGTLRDIDAISKLIEMLSSRDRFVQEAALESLCSITGQQLGLKPHRWKTWHTEKLGGHRIEWIIESLRHRDVPVRRWAADELTRVTGHREPFSAMGDKNARDIAVDAWTQWWEQRGRAQFGGS